MRHLCIIVLCLCIAVTVDAQYVFTSYNKGTAPRNINPGSLTVCNDKLFFICDTVGYSRLWVTDGTQAGTQMVADIDVDVFVDDVNLIAFKDHIYFVARDAIHSWELWKTDGTDTGTHILKDINAGGQPSSPKYFALLKDKLYFSAFENTTGYELYATDGTEAGTNLITDLLPGQGSGVRGNDNGGFFIYNNLLYFNGSDSAYSARLCVSDGTAAGTHSILRDQLQMTYPVVFKNKLYFRDYITTTSCRLWVSDGTGTYLFKDFDATPSVWCLRNMGGVYNGRFYFAAGDANTTGYEPWSTDGTLAGTGVLTDIIPGKPGSEGLFLTAFNNKLYGYAYDALHGYEPWITDGTAAGTHMLADICKGPCSNIWDSTLRHNFTEYNHHLYFGAQDGISGINLWVTKGTDTNTHIVKPLNAQVGTGIGAGNFCVYKGAVYYAANYNGKMELWSVKDTTNYTNIATVNNSVGCTVYPNPSNGNFTIKISQLNNTHAELKLYDATGRLVHTQNIKEAMTSLQLSHLPKGMYEAVLYNGDEVSKEKNISAVRADPLFS